MASRWVVDCRTCWLVVLLARHPLPQAPDRWDHPALVRRRALLCGVDQKAGHDRGHRPGGHSPGSTDAVAMHQSLRLGQQVTPSMATVIDLKAFDIKGFEVYVS